MNKNLYFLVILVLILLTNEKLLLEESKPKKTILNIKDSNLCPIRNKDILLLGYNNILSVSTDNNGFIQLYNIDFGKYIAIIPSNNLISITSPVIICNPGEYSFIIKETLYSEISGTIRDDETNIPINHSIVILFKRNDLTNKYIPCKKTTTDYQGKYSFKYLPCGDYIIKCVG